jgi:drug/metabolite transporter (DMT)-like permease
MQSIRTAGQKSLSTKLNAMATTLTRFLFALPLVWIYLLLISNINEVSLPPLNEGFVTSATLAAIAQIAATAFMIMAFRYQNFAVATSIVKTEAVLTAVVGVILFDAVLSGPGWFSVVIGVAGVIVLSKTDIGFKAIFQSPASAYGIAAALCFAFATLLIRKASLSLEIDKIVSAAYTLAYMVTFQSAAVLAYIVLKNREQLPIITANWKMCSFVGIASMLGSVGWFTAATLQNAAYVKALGQVEFFFSLFITHKIFKERISTREYIGMALIIASVLVLLLIA